MKEINQQTDVTMKLIRYEGINPCKTFEVIWFEIDFNCVYDSAQRKTAITSKPASIVNLILDVFSHNAKAEILHKKYESFSIYPFLSIVSKKF